MIDPYAWIDPFEEIEKAQRQVAWAKEDGRREALSFIADQHTGEFHKALLRAVEYSAANVAERILAPHMARHYHDYRQFQAIKDATLDSLMSIAEPMVAHIARDGKLSLDMPIRSDRMPELHFSVETTQPFQFSVAMTRDQWDRPRRRTGS